MAAGKAVYLIEGGSMNDGVVVKAAGEPEKATQEAPVFRPVTAEEILELQRQSDDVYRNRLTKGGDGTEKTSLDDYTTGMHGELNPLLYGTTAYLPAEQARYWGEIGRIDAAMGKFDLGQGVMVYSGTEAKWYSDWKVGDIRPIDAYLSTSVTEQVPSKHYKTVEEEGGTPLMLEIYVPKGAKCIYIGNNTAYYKMEDELLLGRGQKYKVIERTENLLRLEVMP